MIIDKIFLKSRKLSLDFNDNDIVEEDQTDYDVIIVGAGITGLIAAGRMSSAGLNILILERTATFGGRLLSKRESKSFYGHELQSRLNNLLAMLQIAKRREKFSDNRKIIHYQHDKLLGDEVPFYVAAEVNFFIKTMDRASRKIHFNVFRHRPLDEKLANLSVELVIRRLVCFKKSRSVCRNLVYVTCGIADLANVSALWYFVMLHGAGGFLKRLSMNLGDSNRYFIKGGALTIAQSLTNNIQERCKIHYQETVHHVIFNDDRAHIYTNQKHYKCYYVIIALPPYQSDKIVFAPDLPPNLKGVHRSYAPGNNTFFFASCSKLHELENSAKNIIGAENRKINFRLIYDATCVGEENVYISGFLNPMSDNQDPLVKQDLSKHFRDKNVIFDEYSEKDCSSLMSGCPMCALKPGHLRNHSNVLSEFYGRIKFASSEYATQWPGTIDGAVEAGELAAYSILSHLRPQAMNRNEWIEAKYVSIFFTQRK